MLSNKPYLIRAFYEWIVDSACTPLMVVDALVPRVNVPKEYIENGQVTLNVSPHAIRDFKVNKDLIEFKASFSGVVHIISAPIKAVLAVYAQENGEGMYFDLEEGDDTGAGGVWGEDAVQTTESVIPVIDSTKKGTPHLKLVE